MSVTIWVNNNNGDQDLNLSNSNFYALWQSLNLFIDACGAISPIELEKALDRHFKLNKLIEVPTQEGNFYSGGRSADQVARYYWSLRRLVKEAKELNQAIVWG